MAKKKKSDAAVSQQKPKRTWLTNVVIDRISLVGDDGQRDTLWKRRKHKRGARQKLSVYDYLDDLAAHPEESVRKRAARLGVDRQTIRRLEKERKSNTFFEAGGPVLMVK